MNIRDKIKGLHRVSVVASDAQKALDFFGGVLGLRLVKKTLHYDHPEVYQLYFSNDLRAEDNILTVFVHEGLDRGRQGTGRVNTVSFSVPADSLDVWMKRLGKFKIPFKNPQQRFGEEVFIYFENEDGLGMELVFNEKDERISYPDGILKKEMAVKGFYNVEVWDKGYGRTATFLKQQLDFVQLAEQGTRIRLATHDEAGQYVDIWNAAPYSPGLKGSGTVHSIAFGVPDIDAQFAVREKIAGAGLDVTFALDRTYYKTLYFETPTGILCEISTITPGFTLDEEADKLGEKLMIPTWFEYDRRNIEKKLRPISLEVEKYKEK